MTSVIVLLHQKSAPWSLSDSKSHCNFIFIDQIFQILTKYLDGSRTIIVGIENYCFAATSLIVRSTPFIIDLERNYQGRIKSHIRLANYKDPFSTDVHCLGNPVYKSLVYICSILV